MSLKFLSPWIVLYGDCYFNNLTITEESNQLFEEFGVSAAHKSLETHSQVMLLYGNESIILNINSRIPSDNSTILEISNIAARVLGIRNGGKFKCRVLYEEKSFLYSFISHYPVILVIGGVLGSFQLLGYMFWNHYVKMSTYLKNICEMYFFL